MQFQAVLSNQHHPESGVVTVPFPPLVICSQNGDLMH